MLTEIICDRRLKQFRHIARSALRWIIDEPSELQSKVHQLAGGDPEEDESRIQTVETDLRPANIGLHMACHPVQDYSVWSELMEPAMLHTAACY